MKNIDRVLGILLLLQAQRSISARQLAAQFEVSTRTIYRDLQTLSLLGVPVYAERGRNGGIRLLEGYFLPPLMFSRGEAITLVLGLALLRNLRAAPFADEAITATQKLLAAVPEPLRLTLAHLERTLGIERASADIFHAEAERTDTPEVWSSTESNGGSLSESRIVSIFLQALLDGNTLKLRYSSPYRETEREDLAQPLGLFWDRDRWYLVGLVREEQGQQHQQQRIWRADRVVDLALHRPQNGAQSQQGDAFDVRELLGHAWLREAMEDWRRNRPVHLRITREQAHRLQQDWYYRYAQYEPAADGAIIMTFGESDPALVLPLLRWLGPGAELLSPEPWRDLLRAELTQMLHSYNLSSPSKERGQG